MLRLSLFSLEQEEEDHREHGTKQEDRVLLAVDVKGLVGLWDHGRVVEAGKLKDSALPRWFDAVSIAPIREPSSIPSRTR